RNGYDEGLKLTDNSAVVTVFQDLLALRDRHISSIDNILKDRGSQPNSDGSWMTPVHESIMNLRSWAGALDSSVFDGVINGEERIVEKFDDVLKADRDNFNQFHSVLAMRNEVQAKIDGLRKIANAA
ncbi:MAG: DUF2383 domain-containing protein, partial [Pseudomonadota bacterium]